MMCLRRLSLIQRSQHAPINPAVTIVLRLGGVGHVLLVCAIKMVSLEGLENSLKVGKAEKSLGNTGDINYYAQLIDDAKGLAKIEYLQSHDNNEIFENAVKILDTHWLEEEKPVLNGSQLGFNFGSPTAQDLRGGFSFNG